ncbi:MAG: 4a-hydroxytetrahydrobiopterin dehydratase [Aestuariivirgaceae bacterium]
MADKTYSASEIDARLSDGLTAWHHADGFIQRTYNTSGWKGTLIIVNTIGHLCEAAWHHPDLEVSYNKVTVKLQNHDAGGITDKDFELAGKLDDVVLWRPAGALTGPPASQAYVKDDK